MDQSITRTPSSRRRKGSSLVMASVAALAIALAAAVRLQGRPGGFDRAQPHGRSESNGRTEPDRRTESDGRTEPDPRAEPHATLRSDPFRGGGLPGHAGR